MRPIALTEILGISFKRKKMNVCSKKAILVVVTLWIAVNGSPQSKNELVEKRRRTEEEIALTNKLIDQTRERKIRSLHEIELIESKISARNRLIRNIESEVRYIENKIESNEDVIEALKRDLEKIKKEYANIIYNTYKDYNEYNNLIYILASKSVNQAYSRIKYLIQYKEFRKKQLILIKALENEIKHQTKTLEKSREEKIALISKEMKQKNELLTDRKQKDRAYGELKQKERELEKQLREKERIAEKLEKQIEELILKEEKDNKYAVLTPEQKLISDNFSSNKGRFHWPTQFGVVTSKFGEHPHPVIKNITVRNNGIDISTVNGAEVRSLFTGEVSKVFTIKGANSTVLIRHGQFLTVYHNLINVRVKAGEKVRTKEVIGNVYTDNQRNSSVLHFEIWKNIEKLNPEDWLSN
jgi:septal ring factor EnvC (AmiA/AmiB activator)